MTWWDDYERATYGYYHLGILVTPTSAFVYTREWVDSEPLIEETNG